MTKPIGSGLLLSALKKMDTTQSNLVVDQNDVQEAIHSMATLNRVASDVMLEVGANACTDITGFGFLGHLYEMLSASKVGAIVHVDNVPILSGARDLARTGICSSANLRNRSYVEHHARRLMSDLSTEMELLFYAAETSGGLLMSVANDRASRVMSLLQECGVIQADVIGEGVGEPRGKIILK